MTLEEELQQLKARIEKLEELVTGDFLGAPDQVIRTTQIGLYDDDGQLRGLLGATTEFGAQLTLMDPKGEIRMVLSANGGAPEITMTHADGRPAVELRVDEKDRVLFGMRDTKRVARATISVLPNGAAIDLRDENNKTRMALSMHNKLNPNISLIDEKGDTRLSMSVHADHQKLAGLLLSDEQGAGRLAVGVNAAGESTISMNGPDDAGTLSLHSGSQNQTLQFQGVDHQPRLNVGLAADGKPSITMMNDLGKQRIGLGMTDEQTGLFISDSHQVPRVIASLDADERPWLTIGDPSKTPRIRMTLMPDGSPGIALNDDAGRAALLLTTREDAPGLMLCDPNGKVRAMLSYGPEGPSLILIDESGDLSFQAP